MKKISFYSMMLMAASLTLASCDKNDTPDTPDAGGKAKMVIAIDMSVNESTVGYIAPIASNLLDEGGTLALTNAQEVSASPYIEGYHDWLFYIPNAYEAPIIKRFTRKDDGTLQLDGSLVLSTGNAGLANLLFLSETKAYASLMLENRIIIFNPTTMVKTGVIDLAKTEYGVNGSATPNPMGMILRDGKVFVGCAELSQMPMTNDGAYMLVIDAATDTPEKFISDPRGSSASFFSQGMFFDEKGDIYVMCWASYGYVQTQKSGFLRIKKGATDFDPSYFFNISDRQIDGILGGHIVLTNYCYDANGDAYIFGMNYAYASNPIDYVNDKIIESLKINLYTQTVESLDLPRSNPYSYGIVKFKDLILFGLTTASAGSGFFSYNTKTATASRTPLINAPGTILDVVVFE